MADNLGDHPLKLSFWRFLKSTPCWVALQSFHGRRGRAVSFPTWAMYLWSRKSTAGSPNVSAEGHQHLEDPQHCHFRSRLMPQKRIFREVNIRSCRTSYITYYLRAAAPAADPWRIGNYVRQSNATQSSYPSLKPFVPGSSTKQPRGKIAAGQPKRTRRLFAGHCTAGRARANRTCWTYCGGTCSKNVWAGRQAKNFKLLHSKL